MISCSATLLAMSKDQNEWLCKERVSPDMASTRPRCLPLFSFTRFIAWLVPWSRVRDPWGCSRVPSETSTYVESTTLDAQTNEFLSVSNDDLEYLTREEAEQIIDQFEKLWHSFDRLLFWTGIPREWAQQWADDHGMLTLTSAMGPLMDVANPQCPKSEMDYLKWSRYVKGASGIFSRYACMCGVVRVLTLPPSERWRLRPNSTFSVIEEPVLKGVMGGSSRALRIHNVHLLIGSAATEYEVWPEDHTREWLGSHGTTVLNFMVPPPLSTGSCSNTAKKKKKKRAKPTETYQATNIRPNHASSTPSQTPYRHHPDVELSPGMPQTAEEQKKGLRSEPQHMRKVIKASGNSGKDGLSKGMRLLGGTEDSTRETQQAQHTASLRKARGTSKKQKPALATAQPLSKVQDVTNSKEPMSQVHCDHSGDRVVRGTANQSSLDTTLQKKNKKTRKKAKRKAKKKAKKAKKDAESRA